MQPLPPFQHLLDRHRRDVLAYLVATVGGQDAEDCFQETFLAALRAYPELDDGSNLRGWLFTIAHRKAIDSLRQRRRRPAPAGRADELAMVGGTRLALAPPADGLPGEPEEI